MNNIRHAQEFPELFLKKYSRLHYMKNTFLNLKKKKMLKTFAHNSIIKNINLKMSMINFLYQLDGKKKLTKNIDYIFTKF